MFVLIKKDLNRGLDKAESSPSLILLMKFFNKEINAQNYAECDYSQGRIHVHFKWKRKESCLFSGNLRSCAYYIEKIKIEDK